MEGRGVLKSGGLSKGQLSCRQQSLLVTTNKIYGSLNARMRHKGPSHVLDRDAFCKVHTRISQLVRLHRLLLYRLVNLVRSLIRQ